MRLPEKEYYSLEEIANHWDCKIDDLLHYGEIKKLKICLYINRDFYDVGPPRMPGWDTEVKRECVSGGPCPIMLDPQSWREFRICGHSKGRILVHDFPEKSAFFFAVERDYAVSELIVTNEEKLRFEKECIPKKDMVTERERENLLRLIGAFIEIHYQGNDYKKGDGSPNANKISEKFHEQLALNDFSDKGISDKSFRKLIPEAYNLIMENKEEKTNIIIKKI